MKPLVIEWEPDSDVIGDFTWPGFDSDIIITDRVGRAFRDSSVTGFELSPVKMIENSEKSKRASRKHRVKLPYAGPQLWDLWVTAWAHLDRERSTVRVAGKQPDGSDKWDLWGVERWEAGWDEQQMKLVKRWYPRVDGQGLYVQTSTTIFRVPEFPAWIFCTDDVKRLIEDHRFTNASFLEMGGILDP